MAAGSAAMLVLSHARMHATLESTVAAVDNLTQARLLVADALLARERLASGDPTLSPDRPVAGVDRALTLLDDLREGRSSVLSVTAAPLDGDGFPALADAYAAELRSLRDDIASGAFAAADPVATHARIARIQAAALSLEGRVYDLLRERLAAEDLRQSVRLALWILFLLMAGGAFAAARRARDRAESSRERAEGRYDALASHAEAGVVRTSPDGRVAEGTDWWRATLGVPEGSAEPWWSALPEPERTRVSEIWTRQAARRETFFLEVQAAPEAGQPRWLASRWVRERGEEGEADASWIGTFIEETERRRVQDQLRQSQRLESVGRLTAGIAHDFNNLLSVILSNAELLKRGRDVGPRARGLVEEVEAAARDGRDMVAGLMGFSREAPLEMHPLDAGKAVRAITRLARRLLPGSVELDVRVPPAGPWVHADRRALQQVLLNLVSNARDAMPDGGRILVEVDAVDIDEAYRDVHPWVEPGPFGRIVVGDEGTGMDADTLKRVFDPFFTTKAEGKGTGLGLSTVHGLVRQHGGYVHAYSQPGVGTTFRVYLPLAQAEAGAPEPPVAPGAAVGPDALGRTPLRVLLVDDDEVLRRTARRILVRLGHRVVEAAGGREALRIVDDGDAFDLVISDVDMPHMDGLALYRALQDRSGGLPFVFTSGYSVQEMRNRRGMPEGAAYLPKPWTIDEIRSVLTTMLPAADSA